MKIKKIMITGLYGYIDKEIDFYEDINLLVGINGSGKTSILNIISWLLKPSLHFLCVTEFKRISMHFSYKDAEYTIECRHSKSFLKYSIKSSKQSETFNNLSVRLILPPSKISDDNETRNSLLERYYHLGPSEHEAKTWDFINNFPNPVIVGLDRNLYIEEKEEKIFLDPQHKIRVSRKPEIIRTSPLNIVKDLVNTSYRKRKNEILNLTNNLKNHLMFSAFEGIITMDSLSSGLKQKLSVNQIESVEKRFNDYLNKFESDVFSNDQLSLISNYFSQLKDIAGADQASPKSEHAALFAFNANHFLKLRKLLSQLEKFERESKNILALIYLYLETLNSFFKDSFKQLVFKEDTSEIKFNTIDKNGALSPTYRDISGLSSGEQQILILFSYLAFNSQEGRIFIIDEPELSLHIKWQEEFLNNLEILTQKSTQVFIATHSPIIVGKKKDKAILLLPYNK
ncbi:MAG: AAA family ATPase [Syntrophales bacterium]|jgi:predicted ATPase|nr:AAA family ATPase [Syntrophales bacterium]